MDRGPSLFLLVVALSFISGRAEQCPSGCLSLPTHNLDLRPLNGTWQTVYYTQAEGSTQARVPNFFNISLCGTLPSQCAGSSVCFSELLDKFYSLGETSSCEYSYADSELQFVFDYSEEAGQRFGPGNVTITLVCGKTLGVPEVTVGDPHSHAIEIVWITSAACRNDTNLAAKNETKCYYIHSYEDSGIKAHFYDLTNLIRPEGYVSSHAEDNQGLFNISVCRSLESDNACRGAMACLTQKDPSFNINDDVPIPLAYPDGEQSNLHMEGNQLTAVYTKRESSCDGGKRTVKIRFLCPSGSEALGPQVTFLDNKLCLIVILWYTSYACGSNAIQNTGCQLTTAGGVSFDLSGLGSTTVEVNGTTNGETYGYNVQICEGDSINHDCGKPLTPPVRVAQVSMQSHVCKSAGVGDGKLRFADGALTLTYTGGEKCHTNFARTSVINFVCPESVGNSSDTTRLTFIAEDDCFYEFEWVTPLACGATTSGASSCQFELRGSTYNFAPLVGSNDENWVAVDEDPDTECFMIDPCGELTVTDDSLSPTGYCNRHLAPAGCVGYSVCQILTNGTVVPIGKFNLENSSSLTSIDNNILTVLGERDARHKAVIHYVCKTGDLTTPPVFINVTNNAYYEFHWTTFAACPLGIQIGENCMVTHSATGFTFNLSSLAPPQIFTASDSQHFKYEISVCGPLPHSECDQLDHHENIGLCQSTTAHQYSMGKSNSTLIYADGSLKLHYNEGSSCQHEWPSRNSTILFVCDSDAHTAAISSINEASHCQYEVEIRTKLACPPAFRATECIHFDRAGNVHDLSELSKSIGNWQTKAADGSIYYINICRPLNKVGGCSPLASACRVSTVNGQMMYTNLGLASSASLTTNKQNGRDRVFLRYNFTRTDASSKSCETVRMSIEFVCNRSAPAESGPRFASGGDEADPCQYSFLWDTPAACPVNSSATVSCNVTDSESGYTFDLSPISTIQPLFNSTGDGYTWDLTVCQPLSTACHGSNNAAVCQRSGAGEHMCGDFSTQTLRYFDGSLSLSYTGGDQCHHVNAPRSVLINFECDRTVYVGEPRYVEESNCGYTFEWPTALACSPRELECVAAGGKYDLRPLLENQNWLVNVEESTQDQYVIGGCRSLNFETLPQCPKQAGMGACRYPKVGWAKGVALGYVTGDLVEEEEGVVRLSYYNGEKCAGGRSSVVNVYFHCDREQGAGVPALRDFNPTLCETNIIWFTQYACTVDTSSNKWNITNPVTNQVYDLTHLSPNLTTNYTEVDGPTYTYIVGLAGNPVACPGHSDSDIGACQVQVGSTHSYILGRVKSDTNLTFIGGELRVEYQNGDVCHHVHVDRKAVLTFECDTREFLEVRPEMECEYSFIVHSSLACAREEKIGVECSVQGFGDLGAFLSLRAPPIPVNHTSTAYISVCRPINRDNQDANDATRCPDGSAACMINNGFVRDLGHPDSEFPPKMLDGGNGIILRYTQGNHCNKRGTRFQTQLILFCNRDKPTGVPELVNCSSSTCECIFKWESIHACPLEIPSTNVSKDVCTITDTSSGFNYNFTNIASQEVTIPNSNTKYYLQLCGKTGRRPPSGCDLQDTGVCKSTGSQKQTIISADHKFVVTSHSPHFIEVVYTTGSVCQGSQSWAAVVELQCKREGSTPAPVLVSDSDCELRFNWKHSSFCLGEEAGCAAVDSSTEYVYDLEGLFSQTWTGLEASGGGSFTLSVCRNLNPFTSAAKHCSSPAGICLATTDGKYKNLGHMTAPPKVEHRNSGAVIVLNYTGGDQCEGDHSRKYSTEVTLACSEEESHLTLNHHGDCSYSLMWATPLACRATTTDSTKCTYQGHEGEYNFNPLAHNISFGDHYKICLCPSQACAPAQIWHTTADNTSHNFGTFREMVVPTTTSGPKLIFTDGSFCHGKTKYQSTVFMECDRKEDSNKGTITLQESLSEGCEKYFFWSTPFACLSEEISCSYSVPGGTTFYDFTPLHSDSKPWIAKGTGSYSGDEFLINICGAVMVTDPASTCSPEAAVCLKKKSDSGYIYEDLATAHTQQIKTTADGRVQIYFTGPQKDCPAHVKIDMVCGVGNLQFDQSQSRDCSYVFEWHTPYACKGSNALTTVHECRDHLSASSNFDFYPKNLMKSASSDGYTVETSDGTFHINFCDKLSVCGGSSSVCLRKQDGTTLSIASFQHLNISVDGHQMEVQMSDEQGASHATIMIQCTASTHDPDIPDEKIVFVNAVSTEKQHKYYYFKMGTKKGCSFIVPTEPPTTTDGGGGGGGGGETKAKAGTSAKAVVGVVVAIIIAIFIVTILLGLLLYKKERRRYLWTTITTSLGGSKPSQPVRYRKLSTEERMEETALLEEDSGDSDEKQSDGEEGEGGGEGGGGGREERGRGGEGGGGGRGERGRGGEGGGGGHADADVELINL